LGVTPERLTISGRTDDFREHLRFYKHIDITLDSFPYTGATTACEALWMGVPLVTLRGLAHAGRVGASLLAAAGLEELIAPDEDAYVPIAKSLAADGARLAAL